MATSSLFGIDSEFNVTMFHEYFSFKFADGFLDTSKANAPWVFLDMLPFLRTVHPTSQEVTHALSFHFKNLCTYSLPYANDTGAIIYWHQFVNSRLQRSIIRSIDDSCANIFFQWKFFDTAIQLYILSFLADNQIQILRRCCKSLKNIIDQQIAHSAIRIPQLISPSNLCPLHSYSIVPDHGVSMMYINRPSNVTLLPKTLRTLVIEASSMKGSYLSSFLEFNRMQLDQLTTLRVNNLTIDVRHFENWIVNALRQSFPALRHLLIPFEDFNHVWNHSGRQTFESIQLQYNAIQFPRLFMQLSRSIQSIEVVESLVPINRFSGSLASWCSDFDSNQLNCLILTGDTIAKSFVELLGYGAPSQMLLRNISSSFAAPFFSLPQLKHLSLEGCTDAIPSHSTTMQTLTITDGYQWSSNSLQYILSKSDQLEKLILDVPWQSVQNPLENWNWIAKIKSNLRECHLRVRKTPKQRSPLCCQQWQMEHVNLIVQFIPKNFVSV